MEGQSFLSQDDNPPPQQSEAKSVAAADKILLIELDIIDEQ